MDNTAEDSKNGVVSTPPAPGVSVSDVTWNPNVAFSKNNNGTQDNIELGMHATPRTQTEELRVKLERILDNLVFRIITIILVVIDVTCVIVDLATPDDKGGLETVSLIIVSYFMLEIGARLFVYGPYHFWENKLELVDAIIIIISFIFCIIYAAVDMGSNAALAKLIIAGRLIRVVTIVRLINEKENLERATRHAVSQNKQRYRQDGFDLDLCYITNNVIAMSFPSTGLMAFYRNPIQEVSRFLNLKHKDHHKVFNLCSERMYNEDMFFSVERFRIDDHNVPKLQETLRFAEIAREWMKADEKNVIAIHCKGGKGRTGTMICIWLIESGQFKDAEESLEYFGDKRTDLTIGKKFQGVETPSQSRYVGYFELLKTQFNMQMPPEKKLRLKEINVKNLAGVGQGDGLDLRCRVILDNFIHEYDFAPQVQCKTRVDYSSHSISIEPTDNPVLKNDVKVMFYCSSKDVPKGYDDCAFYFWFFTAFIEDNRLWLGREDLDNPHKSKTWHVFNPTFGVELLFEDA